MVSLTPYGFLDKVNQPYNGGYFAFNCPRNTRGNALSSTPSESPGGCVNYKTITSKLELPCDFCPNAGNSCVVAMEGKTGVNNMFNVGAKCQPICGGKSDKNITQYYDNYGFAGVTCDEYNRMLCTLGV